MENAAFIPVLLHRNKMSINSTRIVPSQGHFLLFAPWACETGSTFYTPWPKAQILLSILEFQSFNSCPTTIKQIVHLHNAFFIIRINFWKEVCEIFHVSNFVELQTTKVLCVSSSRSSIVHQCLIAEGRVRKWTLCKQQLWCCLVRSRILFCRV